MATDYTITSEEIVFQLNPKVYSLERVYATTYVFLDRFYFLLDGDPKEEIIVKVRPKGKEDLEHFAKTFLDQLISITNYFNQFQEQHEVISLILQKALETNKPKPLSAVQEQAIKKLYE